jgi:cytochrome c oxidase subunit III
VQQTQRKGKDVADTIINHGYIPEEHAPDPVISHGDPTPPGKIAIWLFLASEIMFFIGILATYIILRSGSWELFDNHAESLSWQLAGLNTLVLIFSSLTMALSVDAAQRGLRGRMNICLLITFLMACGFLVIKTIEYADKFGHYTIMIHDSADDQFYIYDGHIHGREGNTIELEGLRLPVTPGDEVNVHLISEVEMVNAGAETGTWHIDASRITQQVRYGPEKNIFYASYFTLTGVHGVHVIGGMVPIAILLIQGLRRRIFAAATEYVGLYWHFVDLVWIFLFPLLYLL